MATAPAVDTFGQGIGQPAINLWDITPSDTVELQFITRGIRVGGAGDLAILTLGGQTVTIGDVVAGETIPVMARKVYATNTT